MAQIKFGTDGWRAVIAEDYTFDNVRKVSQALIAYMQKEGLAQKGLAIGYDTRFGSEQFAAAVAEVSAANGLKTYLTSRFVPTPALSHSITQLHVGAGVMITASHNPPADNGFKIKSDIGGSADPAFVSAVEKLVDTPVQRMKLSDAMDKGLVQYYDPTEAYLAQLANMVDIEGIKNSELDIIVDSMFGAGQGVFPQILAGGKCTIAQLRGERNPAFPGMHNPEPIAKNLNGLLETMRDSYAELGIANDGDADRVGIVDENGRFMNQLEVYALLAFYMLEIRGERGALVKSISTTSMAEKLGKLYGVDVHETPVGFKHIGPKMLETNAVMGGEESGGFAFRGHIPERDGILSGLMIADMMVKTGKSASGLLDLLFDKVGPHYYDRIDFTFEQEKRAEIMQNIKTNPPKELSGSKVARIRDDDGFKYYAEDGSWLLIRFSGTEPIMRVYTETGSPDKVQENLNVGRSLTGA
jgi:alpha-D-glucose phosphate-specific phosphoglucomutase